MRYFALTSLVGVLLVTAVLIATWRELALRNLVDHEQRASADLARAFANAVWVRHSEFVLGSRGKTREQLLRDGAQQRIASDVLTSMHGLAVVKVKIYNTDGLTVFSTDERQVGEDKRQNPGFLAAREGRVTGELTHRDRFDAFDGVIANRDLIFTYVPVRAAPGGVVEGVLEVYSDVTGMVAQRDDTQWKVALTVAGSLGLLYAFLSAVVRRADRVIAQQEAERAAREAQMRHQAHHDALTGLPNRTHFADRLNDALSLARRRGRRMAVMFIDLDRFKIVNDSLGHGAGDALLTVAAGRIRAALRTADLLFRMGGDEFTVLLPDIAAPEEAARVARRIAECVASPFTVREHEILVGATIGIALWPGDGESADELVKNADAAMYSAKQANRGTHFFYQPAMNERAPQRLALAAALQKALGQGEFVLHYQPRLDCDTRRVVAAEALLRWARPAQGLVPPSEFIGVLEDTGLMHQVGEWVLRTACAQQRLWCQQGLAPLRVSVNVSARQFQNPGFDAVVARALADTGIDPARLELELTESLLITAPKQAQATVHALKNLGVAVAIDDFGTGYSSLSYLRDFQVDFLKMDRSFVRDIEHSPRDRAVVTAIAQMAHALGITLVAEGVETEAQAEFFGRLKCGELQGYLYARPMPPEALSPFLLERAEVS